ncbi:zf-HC2 domain-containing protein [soil metagenome]
MSDRYSEWDASYVLGALSPVERREFETHLATCASCSAAVAELAGLPGLLAKVPVTDVDALVEGPEPLPVPSTLLPRLIRSAERRRRRTRGLIAGIAVAAAAAAAAVVIAIPLVTGGGIGSAPVAERVSLTKVVASPLSADIRLIKEGWGTRIEMDCRYGKPATAGYQTGDAPATPRGYAMFVTDVAGEATQVATWTAKPGSSVEPSGTTSLDLDQIASIEVRSSANGTVLLRGKP